MSRPARIAVRIAALAALAALIALGVKFGHKYLKERVPADTVTAEEGEDAELTAENALRCYFPVPAGLEPAEELRVRPENASTLDLARKLLEELHRGPENAGNLRLFPEGTSLRASFLAHDGTLYLDYPADAFEAASGPREEFLFMRCLARALLRNCPEIRSFVLLVDGRSRRRMFLHLPAHGRYVLPRP